MRTKEEIAEEIAALKSLKPVGYFKDKTKRKIALAIEELQHGVDQTADEFDELGEEFQDIVQQTLQWKEGDTDEKVSEGWGGLVA